MSAPVLSILPASSNKPSRIGIVHDWLTTYVGGERVLEQMIALYGEATVYTTIDMLSGEERAFLQGKQPVTSFAQRIPLMRKHYRKFLLLLMVAVEQLDLSDCDMILSSSASIGKGILTGPDQLHIAYIHSPMRYAWDLHHEYLREAGLTHGAKGRLAQWMLHRARLWDLRTVNGVDHFIANSHYISRRIWKVYRRESTVIYPPVDVDAFALREDKEPFYLTASRMVPYKRVPSIVQAFSLMPNRRLVVIGDGPDMRSIKNIAGPNVEILGYQRFEVLRDYMQRAKAFIFAAEEDFGIAPVEAQACGTPVIAYAGGGALETIRGLHQQLPTGMFFRERTAAKIAEAIESFDRGDTNISARACRDNALRFSTAVFRKRYAAFVTQCWDAFQSGIDARVAPT